MSWLAGTTSQQGRRRFHLPQATGVGVRSLHTLRRVNVLIRVGVTYRSRRPDEIARSSDESVLWIYLHTASERARKRSVGNRKLRATHVTVPLELERFTFFHFQRPRGKRKKMRGD